MRERAIVSVSSVCSVYGVRGGDDVPTDEIDVQDAARILGVTDRQVLNLINQGELRPDRTIHTRHRKFHYFHPETIETYKRKREGKESPETTV